MGWKQGAISKYLCQLTRLHVLWPHILTGGEHFFIFTGCQYIQYEAKLNPEIFDYHPNKQHL